jgi:hypothetical protein|tara:strand:+ start:640 stop:1113 length:474 start_codon:yes stop_codon:yes gene_type:complete
MIKRLTPTEAEGYLPLKENFSDTKVTSAEYFTITPSDRGEGWEDVTYYTGRKRGIYNKQGEGDQWVYVLSNPTSPGLYKIGYTKLTPDERAKQISSATGVPLPYEVAWAYRCFNGELLEGEVHHALSKYRVNNQREFFQIDLEIAKETINSIGKNFS